jgi:hypothetical protein
MDTIRTRSVRLLRRSSRRSEVVIVTRHHETKSCHHLATAIDIGSEVLRSSWEGPEIDRLTARKKHPNNFLLACQRIYEAVL